MITGALRQQLRAATLRFLTDTCTIEAGAQASGSMGEVLEDQYVVVATGVPCRIITMGNRYSEVARKAGERETITEAYRLIAPYGTAFDVNQRITLNSDGSQWQIVDLSTSRTTATDAQAVIVRIHG